MDWPVPIIILVGALAWFGHAFLMTVALNWTYAHALKRNYLKAIRAVIAISVFSFPILFAISATYPPAHFTFVAYIALCAAVTLIYLPVVSLVRAARRAPAAVIADTSHVLDVAALLGGKPVGDGKQWRLACLPGNQVFQVEFRELALRLPRLPLAWDGLTILHVSDLHLCGTPGRQFYQQVFDHALQRGVPDLVALTGDVVDSWHHHRWIIPLLGRLKWSIAAFAVLGNHDLYHEPDLVRRRLRRTGFRVLGNGSETIDVRDVPLVVIGNETPWFRPAPDLDVVPAEPFRLCLSHTPDNFGWGQRNGIDLMLAGHVHGGQIRVPGLGPLFVPSRFSRRYDQGQFAAGSTVLSVSRGLSGGEPLRYNCRPEVTRIVLQPNWPQIDTDEHR
jgi:predicted MPP superfamily phosphohydrolase